MIKKLDCGCEVSDADGFRYRTCEDHVLLNPCFPYWDWEAQQAARQRVRDKVLLDREWAL